MIEPTRKPVLRVRIGNSGDLLDYRQMTVKGSDAWCLRNLIEKGDRGITAFDEIGPRLSHDIYKLRRAGLTIETKDKHRAGPFAGIHGKYVLVSSVSVLEEGAV